MAKLMLGRALKLRGMSKRQFAKKIGIDYKNVFRLFHKGADPRLSALNKYAKALRCKVRDLLKE